MHLDVFEGPFDLLLALISKHKLDITEIALSQVTDEFIALHPGAWPARGTSTRPATSCVVAATLLDLKAARLLPAGEVEDEEDLALLEARDLLFARLLQYRAYKEVAAVLAGRMARQARCSRAASPMEPRFAELLPEVLLGLGAGGVRRAGRPGADAQTGPRGVGRAHARAPDQRARAGRAPRRAAARRCAAPRSAR